MITSESTYIINIIINGSLKDTFELCEEFNRLFSRIGNKFKMPSFSFAEMHWGSHEQSKVLHVLCNAKGQVNTASCSTVSQMPM